LEREKPVEESHEEQDYMEQARVNMVEFGALVDRDLPDLQEEQESEDKEEHNMGLVHEEEESKDRGCIEARLELLTFNRGEKKGK